MSTLTKRVVRRLNKKTVEEAELKKEKAKSEKGLRYMQAYMVQANKQLQERK